MTLAFKAAMKCWRRGAWQVTASSHNFIRSCNVENRRFLQSTRILTPVKHAAPMQTRGFATGAEKTVKINFVNKDGSEDLVEATIGDSMLVVALDNDLDIEGACGGEVACSTCHMIFDQKTFDSLPKMDEEEEDMLDLALCVTDTSRLGCQVKVTKEFENITIKIPAETANLQ